MKIGVTQFPTDYSMPARALGPALEERGFESFWAAEHTHIPASRKTPYPEGGDLPSIYWESYDPFIFLAQVSAVTETIKLGTSICLVPEHHPISLAKRVASLDAASGGRFLFGVGGGWNAEELRHHGVAFEDRWKFLVESCEAMKRMWTEKDAEYHGKFVDFEKSWVEPKPVTQPHPPIFIGANSEWGVKRAVAVGDGWMPIHRGDFDLGERMDQLVSFCAEAGRDPAEIQVTMICGAPPTPEEVETFAQHGVTRMALPLPSAKADELLPILDGYAAFAESID